MKEATKQVIKLTISSDPTATDEERKAINAICEGTYAPALINSRPIDRVLKREEVAKILGISTRGVDWYGRQGKLRRVSMGGTRSIGYSESSVRAVIEAK